MMLKFKITFFIKANGDNKSPIYYRLLLNGEKVEIATGLHVEHRFWDKQKQVAKMCSDANAINSATQTISATIVEAITKLQLSGVEVSIDNLKKLMKGEAISTNYYLVNVTSEHNELFEKQIGIKYSYGSFKNYKTTHRFLKEFIRDQYKTQDLSLNEINQRFCEEYFVWLTTVKTCMQNGAGKHLQRLKKIMNYSVKMGYILSNPMKLYSISMKQVPRVALTWDEISNLQRLTLQTKTLQDVRNIFIFQVFTGLSYSDVKALCPKHLMRGTDKNLWLRMERVKTNNTFAVPLLKAALEILQIYISSSPNSDSPIFPVLSNQKMNSNLKVIQKIACISKNFHTHLARHTFATTVTLLNGVPLETVSKMLGHAKLTMTQNYARVGELKIAIDMKLLEEKLSVRLKVED